MALALPRRKKKLPVGTTRPLLYTTSPSIVPVLAIANTFVSVAIVKVPILAILVSSGPVLAESKYSTLYLPDVPAKGPPSEPFLRETKLPAFIAKRPLGSMRPFCRSILLKTVIGVVLVPPIFKPVPALFWIMVPILRKLFCNTRLVKDPVPCTSSVLALSILKALVLLLVAISIDWLLRSVVPSTE